MISKKGLDYIKEFAEIQVNVITNGCIFFLMESDTIVWEASSKDFSLQEFKVGETLAKTSISHQAIEEKKTTIGTFVSKENGARVKVTAIPVTNEEGNVSGAFTIVLPKEHHLVSGFKDFAPVITEMFPGGAFLSVTDTEKITQRQPSKNFDLKDVYIGKDISIDPAAMAALKTGEIQRVDYDTYEYGAPLRILVSPFYDEDTNEVIGALNIVRPKTIELSLRDMASSLKNGLTQIAATIEELAASATDIHGNQQQLNDNIKKITETTEEINKISTFIKSIANQTNMLGLNAAIEAARVGEAGKGFSVVASEIRQMSEKSKNTVAEIEKLTNEIRTNVSESNNQSIISLTASQEQAAATEEITASLEEITALSDELSQIANKL
ncbi:methyl-accepting chemotaxis protein [Anaerocolumna cellulosilytica]|nr:methyl-accepting chemotaxis protein [Anaerocolumna cellulosilytica]MBB5194782.1 cell division protein FtsB [Anaerocolumna cellulosilytica]